MLESRLVAQAWEYTLSKLPEVMRGPPLEIWMQRCYYAGAQHVLSELMESAGMAETDDLTPSDKDKCRAILDELAAFFSADVAAYRAGDRGTQQQ